MTAKTDEKQVSGNGRPARGRDFYVEMAKNPRSRVILANTADTYMLADITRQSDLIISRLRDSLLRSVTIEEFTGHMDEFYKIIFRLEDHLAKIGEKVGIKYRKSRTYKETLKRRNEASADLLSPSEASS
jgi:hypothetical protein